MRMGERRNIIFLLPQQNLNAIQRLTHVVMVVRYSEVSTICTCHSYRNLTYHQPKAYWVRVNANRLLPFEGMGPISDLLRVIDRRYQRNLGRFRRALNRNQSTSNSKSVE